MDEIFKKIEKTSETPDEMKLIVLNAVIEAARAGESGKDLALRANEIAVRTAR